MLYHIGSLLYTIFADTVADGNVIGSGRLCLDCTYILYIGNNNTRHPYLIFPYSNGPPAEYTIPTTPNQLDT